MVHRGGLGVKAAVWSLDTLALAGNTGLVRKPT
jgi:hypothetical protein